MQRRTLLKGIGASFLAGPVALFKPSVAHAIEPATCIAIAQAGIAVVRMFSKGGPDIASMIAAQTEMIKAMSAQLGVIDQKLGLIMRQLDEIRQLIEGIPTATVLESYRAKILGVQQRYLDAVDLYSATQEREGTQAAQRKYADHFERYVIEDLYRARSDLLSTYTSFSLVPLVAKALWIETDAMIMANADGALITRRLRQYDEWFKAIASHGDKSGLPAVMASTAENITKLRNEATSDTKFYCANPWINKGPLCPGNDDWCRGEVMESKIYIENALAVSTEFDGDAKTAVLEMVELGIFAQDTRPWNWKLDTKKDEVVVDNFLGPAIFKQEHNVDVFTLTECSKVPTAVPQRESRATELTKASLWWIALCGFEHSRTSSLSFIEDKLVKLAQER